MRAIIYINGLLVREDYNETVAVFDTDYYGKNTCIVKLLFDRPPVYHIDVLLFSSEGRYIDRFNWTHGDRWNHDNVKMHSGTDAKAATEYFMDRN